jgi:acylphosphatase
MADAVRKRVVAHGQVQGVFYRDTCRRTAAQLGVTGWVRNCLDGTVEAVVEGEPSAVDRLVDWMRDGPPYARVDRLEIHDEQPEGLRDFRIR